MKSIKIAFFGKGGIGKTTIAANFVAFLSMAGKKVLMVGCDPKMDSTKLLMGDEAISPFMDGINPYGSKEYILSQIHNSPILNNVDCMEVGGPEPGVGCAGVGIGIMMDMLAKYKIVDSYDFVIFDVLGDIVCGGFAGPLRNGFADVMLIVTSDEIASLYAANRLVEMAYKYRENGIKNLYLVANLKEKENLKKIELFSNFCNVEIASKIYYDINVRMLSDKNKIVITNYRKSNFLIQIAELYKKICSFKNLSYFKPLKASEFNRLMVEEINYKNNNINLSKHLKKTDQKKSFKIIKNKYKINFIALLNEQLLMEAIVNGNKIRFLVIPAIQSKGLIDYNDWFICLDPATHQQKSVYSEQLVEIKQYFSDYAYDEIKDYFLKFDYNHDKEDSSNSKTIPVRPISNSKQWHRFIFSSGFDSLFTPPGTVIIEHGDSECKFSEEVNGKLGFLNIKEKSIPSIPKSLSYIINDEMSESDVIYGDGPLLKKTIDRILKYKPDSFIEVYNCCTPLLISNDKSFISGYNNVYLEKFNSFNEKTSDEKVERRIDYLVKRIKQFENNSSKKYDFNFINLSRDEKFYNYLSKKVSFTTFIEDDSPALFYRAVADSKYQVIFKKDCVLEGAFKRLKKRYVLLKEPYGFKNTFIFLKTLGELNNKKDILRPSKDLIYKFKKTKEINNNIKIGIVIDINELEFMIVNNFNKSIPFFDLISEAGFNLNIFCYTKTPKEKNNIKKILSKYHIKANYYLFSQPKNLFKLILDNSISVVYSDIRYDRRLVEIGVNSFSTDIYEMGFDGFFKTVEKIKKISEWDFYRRYAELKR